MDKIVILIICVVAEFHNHCTPVPLNHCYVCFIVWLRRYTDIPDELKVIVIFQEQSGSLNKNIPPIGKD